MKNNASIHTMTLPSAMLERGFWLYVWRVTTENKRKVYYVGRTGDSSSPNAAPPYQRMGQHLGHQKNTNALRKYLEKANIKLDQCKFELIAFGPIFSEAADMESHEIPRDKMAALEKKLACAMKEVGYEVLNIVRSRKPLNQIHWQKVKSEFIEHFPKLANSV